MGLVALVYQNTPARLVHIILGADEYRPVENLRLQKLIRTSRRLNVLRWLYNGHLQKVFMDEQQVLDLYMEYIRAFEDKDYTAIADRCRTPFFASSPSGTSIFGNRKELLDGFSLLRGSLDADGYVTSRLNNLDFTSVSENTGTLLVDFHRMNREGELYFHGSAMYVFQSKNQTTDIIGVVVLDDQTVSSWENRA